MAHYFGNDMDKRHIEKIRKEEEVKGCLELKCPKCEAIHSTIDSFIFHQKVHKKKNEKERYLFQCNECCYSSPVMDHLRKHLMRHYDIKPFKCKICEWTCVTKHQLKTHNLTHLSLKRSRYAR